MDLFGHSLMLLKIVIFLQTNLKLDRDTVYLKYLFQRYVMASNNLLHYYNCFL